MPTPETEVLLARLQKLLEDAHALRYQSRERFECAVATLDALAQGKEIPPMRTTREDIRGWLNEAWNGGARWVVVQRDWFDGTVYPVSLNRAEEVLKVLDVSRQAGTDSAIEVYDLALDVEEQLGEQRAWHPPKRDEPVEATREFVPENGLYLGNLNSIEEEEYGPLFIRRTPWSHRKIVWPGEPFKTLPFPYLFHRWDLVCHHVRDNRPTGRTSWWGGFFLRSSAQRWINEVEDEPWG